MSAATFPILTFDEATLSPSLGYVFDPQWLDPYESVVSMLWKLAWMNRLTGHVVVGHIAKRPVDPYEGIAATPAELDIRHIARALGVPLKTVRTALQRPGWRRGVPSPAVLPSLHVARVSQRGASVRLRAAVPGTRLLARHRVPRLRRNQCLPHRCPLARCPLQMRAVSTPLCAHVDELRASTSVAQTCAHGHHPHFPRLSGHQRHRWLAVH
jgi:hypothetical protein